jgi:GTP-dependent phosphoenolpyruvate carboxykinase
MDALLAVDKSLWMDECELIAEHQAQFGRFVPKEMKLSTKILKSRLS